MLTISCGQILEMLVKHLWSMKSEPFHRAQSNAGNDYRHNSARCLYQTKHSLKPQSQLNCELVRLMEIKTLQKCNNRATKCDVLILTEAPATLVLALSHLFSLVLQSSLCAVFSTCLDYLQSLVYIFGQIQIFST